MATIMRMKMARSAVYSAQKVVRSRLRPGVRSYAETTRCSYLGDGISQRQDYGIRSTPTPLSAHMCHRSFSQSVPLLSSSPQMEREILASPLSPTSSDTIGEAPREDKRDHDIDIGDKHEHIQKQSSHTTRIFFQTIAPHVETRTLIQLTKQLSRIVSRGHHKFDSQDRAGKKATLKRRLDALFNPTGKNAVYQPPSGTWSLKGHPWLKPTIYSYFMGKLLDKPDREVAIPLDIEDPTYPPNQNLQQHEQHLETLMKARKASLRHPIFWSDKSMRESGYAFNHNRDQTKKSVKVLREEKQQKHRGRLAKQHSRKTEEELQREAESVLDILVSRLPPPHFSKLMGALESFANLDSASSSSGDASQTNGSKADTNDSWYIDSASSDKSLPALPESRDTHTDWQRHRIPVLARFLNKNSPSHAYMVAVDLGRYFYVDLEGVQQKEGGEEEDNVADATGDHNSGSANDKKIIRKQRKLHSMEKKYHKTKEDFVEKMMELQHEFASWEKESGDDEETSGEVPQGALLDDISHSGEQLEGSSDDEDASSDLVAGGIRPGTLKREQEDDLAETLTELRRMGLRSGDEKKSRGRPKKGNHVKFSAIRIEQKDDLPASNDEPSEQTAVINEAELEDRIVFINNLPIDITEAEIDQIYSRCGPLESIQLFNKRPDLDPGPMTKKQLEERRRQKKLRYKKNSYLTLNQFQTQRPRTPVYGMLRFKTAEGYNTATWPELCTFGCVIRRHPVLSIKAQEVSTLYLEQIPSNLYSMDVEYRLAQFLHPHNIHIMMDGMKGVGVDGRRRGMNENNQDYSNPSSCQVQFEDFHTASQAHQWIRGGGDGSDEKERENSIAYLGDEECQMHWFRTPENAMEYWTRDLGF